MDMGMVDMDMVDTDGGVLHFIIPPAGVDGMVVQGLMAFTETIFMCIITYMLTTPIMFTETGVAYPARVIIAQVVLQQERRIIIARLWVQPDPEERSIQDQIVQGPEPVIIITDPWQTDQLLEDPPQDITLPVERSDLPYIPIVREMFISGRSQIATIGNKDKTEPGRR